MTSHAIQGRAALQLRFRDMVAWFARGTLAVVTTGAIGRSCEGAVINFCTAPGAGGFMAALTRCDATVCGVVRLARQAIDSRAMATCTACSNRHITVKFGRCPACETLVASAAGCRRRNMTAGFARGRLTIVAACTICCCSKRAVIHLGTAPSTG